MAKLPSSNKLSILTPTHILEDYLADCEGIANVSYYNFPIILPFALSLERSNDRTILISQWFLIAQWERYWFGKFNNLWLIETTILKNFISDDIKVSSTCSHLYIFSNCLTLKCYKIQVLFIFFRDWYLFVLVETSHEKKNGGNILFIDWLFVLLFGVVYEFLFIKIYKMKEASFKTVFVVASF